MDVRKEISGGKDTMELSKRLQAVASLVSDGYRLADIGTDHAFIPISLTESGRIPGAVAMDVNRGSRFGGHSRDGRAVDDPHIKRW